MSFFFLDIRPFLLFRELIDFFCLVILVRGRKIRKKRGEFAWIFTKVGIGRIKQSPYWGAQNWGISKKKKKRGGEGGITKVSQQKIFLLFSFGILKTEKNKKKTTKNGVENERRILYTKVWFRGGFVQSESGGEEWNAKKKG